MLPAVIMVLVKLALKVISCYSGDKIWVTSRDKVLHLVHQLHRSTTHSEQIVPQQLLWVGETTYSEWNHRHQRVGVQREWMLVITCYRTVMPGCKWPKMRSVTVSVPNTIINYCGAVTKEAPSLRYTIITRSIDRAPNYPPQSVRGAGCKE